MSAVASHAVAVGAGPGAVYADGACFVDGSDGELLM